MKTLELKGHKQFSLDNLICQTLYVDGKGWKKVALVLTEEHRSAFFDIFAKGCRLGTKEALARAANDNFSRLKPYGIYKRVMFNSDGKPCQYVAGQDYPGEVTYIRNLILKTY